MSYAEVKALIENCNDANELSALVAELSAALAKLS
jgi:hypothetical protein